MKYNAEIKFNNSFFLFLFYTLIYMRINSRVPKQEPQDWCFNKVS